MGRSDTITTGTKRRRNMQLFKRKKNDSREATTDEDDGVPVDRGWSWVISFCNFVSMLVLLGNDQLMFVLFVDIVEEFKQPVSVMTSLFTVQGLSASISSILTSNFLMSRFSVRTICVTAALLSSLSTLCISQTTNVVVLMMLYCIKGCCFGANMVCPISLIGFYFKKHRGLATSLANTGICVAAMVFPAIAQALRTEYALRGSLLIMSAIELHLVPVYMLLRPVESYRKLHKKARVKHEQQTLLLSRSTLKTQQNLDNLKSGNFSSPIPKINEVTKSGFNVEPQNHVVHVNWETSVSRTAKFGLDTDTMNFSEPNSTSSCAPTTDKENPCHSKSQDIHDSAGIEICSEARAGSDPKYKISCDTQHQEIHDSNFHEVQRQKGPSFDTKPPDPLDSSIRQYCYSKNSDEIQFPFKSNDQSFCYSKNNLPFDLNHRQIAYPYQEDSKDPKNLCEKPTSSLSDLKYQEPCDSNYAKSNNASNTDLQFSQPHISIAKYPNFYDSLDKSLTEFKNPSDLDLAESQPTSEAGSIYEKQNFSQKDPAPFKSVSTCDDQKNVEIILENNHFDVDDPLASLVEQKFEENSIQLNNADDSEIQCNMKKDQKISLEDNSTKNDDVICTTREDRQESKPAKCTLKTFIDLSLFKVWTYRMMAIFTPLATLNNLLIIYLPTLAVKSGVHKSHAAVLMTIIGVTDFFSRIVIGFVADTGIIRKAKLVAISLVVLGVTCQFARFITTSVHFTIFAVIIGLFYGCRQNLMTVMVIDYVGADRVAKGLGIIAMLNSGVMSANHPIVGALLESPYGGVHVLLHYIGGSLILGTLVLLCEPIFMRLDRKKNEEKLM